MLVQSTSIALQKTGMRQDHALALATGVLTSIWVTFLSLAVGALVQSFADGAHSPIAFIAWCKDGHLYGYAITQVVAPGIRGYLAYMHSKKNTPAPAEGAHPEGGQ